MLQQGYSGTPLAKKLGIKQGYKIRLVNQPEYYFELFTDMPENVTIIEDSKAQKAFVHYFTVKSTELHRDIKLLRNEIFPNGIVWISWPKKSAKIASDVSEDVIRNLAINNGLVDIKVCSLNEIWSGLKLVVPVKDRNLVV